MTGDAGHPRRAGRSDAEVTAIRWQRQRPSRTVARERRGLRRPRRSVAALAAVARRVSWGTRSRLIGASFRNWDLPQRRQIFAGLRLAMEAP